LLKISIKLEESGRFPGILYDSLRFLESRLVEMLKESQKISKHLKESQRISKHLKWLSQVLRRIRWIGASRMRVGEGGVGFLNSPS